MAFFERYKSIYWRNVAIRFTLILVTVALIVFFMPRNRGVQLRYDIGKPWMYGSFIAKFDFPVYKTDEAVKAEQDSALKSFQPYYNYDAKLEKSEIKQFYHDFSVGIEGMPSVCTGLPSVCISFIARVSCLRPNITIWWPTQAI